MGIINLKNILLAKAGFNEWDERPIMQLTNEIDLSDGIEVLPDNVVDFDNLDIKYFEAGQDLQSSNFVTGSAGWQIKGNGVAEFQAITITGSITATTGVIGGWTIGASALTATGISLDSSNRQITLGASDEVILSGTDKKITVGNSNKIFIDGANERIQSDNYVSGYAGSGFHLSDSLLEVGNIACRGLIRTSVFQKDTINVMGGNFMVLDGDVLDEDMTALDASTLTTKATTTFSVNDILRIKDGTDDEWLKVTAVNGAVYTVERDKAAAYGADANPAWKKGATVVNYGQSGDGGVYQTASESNAPYLSVFTHAGSPWTDLITRLRIGNLNGYLGYTTDLYGIGIGDTDHYLKYDPTNHLRISGTITGSVIQTATSGQRIRIITNAGSTPTQLANSLALINSSNDFLFNVGSSASYVTEIISALTGVGGLHITNKSGVEYSSDLVNFQISEAGSTGDVLSLATAGSGVCLDLTNTGTGAHIELHPKASVSAALSEGFIYADTDHKVYYYNGSDWLSMVEQGMNYFEPTAGELLDSGKAVFIANSTAEEKICAQDTSTGDSTLYFGRNGANYAVGQRFYTYTSDAKAKWRYGQGVWISRVSLILKKIGSPTDNVKVSIYASNYQAPTGDVIASGTIAASSLTTSLVEYDIDIGYAQLSANTYYVLVVERTGDYDSTNHYEIDHSDYNPYDDPAGETYETRYNVGGWTQHTANDLYFKLKKTYTNGKVYLACARLTKFTTGFCGITKESIAEGVTGKINTYDVSIPAQAGLTAGATYYLSNTYGQVATSAGVVSKKVGLGLSATELQILNTV